MSPTVAVAIGAAAGMAAGTRLLFASVLFAGLLVGRPGLDAIPAAVLAVGRRVADGQAATDEFRSRRES